MNLLIFITFLVIFCQLGVLIKACLGGGFGCGGMGGCMPNFGTWWSPPACSSFQCMGGNYGIFFTIINLLTILKTYRFYKIS